VAVFVCGAFFSLSPGGRGTTAIHRLARLRGNDKRKCTQFTFPQYFAATLRIALDFPKKISINTLIKINQP
jgi:hypothetical protein